MRMILVSLLWLFLAAPPLPDASSALAGIAHVALRVNDVPKTREFYRTLGFEQAFEFADPGKPLVSYIKINDRQFIELYGRAEDSQPTGLLHVCYEASDIEKLWNEYIQRGLNPPSPRKARAGNLLFLFRDPEEQLLEFTQYLPGSLHFADRGAHLGARRISEHLVRAVITVKDVNAERLFYTSKLAFQEIAPNGTTRLRLPGDSRDEVALEVTTAATKPSLVFTVTDLAGAAKELRSRGIAVRAGDDAISVCDPDGAVLEFVVDKNELEATARRVQVP